MRWVSTTLRVAAAVTLAACLAGTVQAQSITPATGSYSALVGQTFTVHKTLTVGSLGATSVDLFFLADNTGSMGGIVGSAQAGASAILSALPSTYRFGVGSYLGDPVEGPWEIPYTQNQALTSNKAAAQAGINAWYASGGGDWPEANFYALKQVADNAGWLPTAQRLIVWFGDAPSHTATTTQAQAISALQAANAKVVAFNTYGSGSGIDTYGQASAVVAGAGGALVNDFYYGSVDFVGTVLSQISAATSTIDLIFGSDLALPGLNLSFTCTDPLGCTGVGGGQSRTFDMTVAALAPGTYDFSVFAQGVAATELDHVTVLAADTVPEPVSLVLFGTGLAGLGAIRRRRKARG